MTRRILLAVLALTAAVLVAAVVPLALKAIAHDQQSYVYATEQTAHSVAAVAEEPISANTSNAALRKTLSDYARQGDGVLVLDANRHTVIGRGDLPAGWQRLAAKAMAETEPSTEVTKTRVIVAEPTWYHKIRSDTPLR